MSVITIGNLNLYDPNENIGGSEYSAYGFGTNPNNNNAVNQEDLIMYCNLRAFTRPRSYIMNSNSDGVKTQAVASARINFLKPNKDKDKFTTDWTELDASGKPNGEEMLGINSVQITYDTSYVPRVTITMTDVRGQALNEDPKDSPYGAFFNFPYPMFVLEVKGYYGKAVKYLLHLLKYSSRFDYSTGNFQITCEFVGFTYALLSDLNVQYGLVASQMEINGKSGKDRLIKKFELQAKKYPEMSDEITNIINSNVFTLVDLINKSKDLNTFVSVLNQENQKFREKASLDNFIDLIQRIYDEVTKTTVLNNTFNEKVKTINGDSLFINFPNYGGQLKCDNTAPTDSPINPISNEIINSYKLYFENSKNIINNRNNEITKELDDEVKSELKEFLGFTPTIRNIMLIICNNFELFLDLITETTQSAADTFNRKNKLKNIMDDGNPKRVESKQLEEIYPWPVLFNDNYEICYFDDLPLLNKNDYPERQFVESYLNATKTTNRLLESTGKTDTNTALIADQILFNPIHSQQYSPTTTPFSIKNILYDIVEHALLLSSNSWGIGKIDQVEKFGEMDANNLYKILGETGIKTYATTLKNNLTWINDSKDNNYNNQPLGLLQIIDESKDKVIYYDKTVSIIQSDIKQKFRYLKNYKSNYFTDIVETEGIKKLKQKYDTLNNLRFVPEIKDNVISLSADYGAGSVKVGNNGFIKYEKEKFEYPNEISLKAMFFPFMEKQDERMVYNKTLLNNDTNLLTSLENVLYNLQAAENTIKTILKYLPGVLDDFSDFTLFNGIHITKMVNALSYLFFNNRFYMSRDGDYKNPFNTKYNYYFPFTTPNNPDSYENIDEIYIANRKAFLEVYKELVEFIAETIQNGLTRVGENHILYDIDIYQTENANSDNAIVPFTINKNGNTIVFRNNGNVSESVKKMDGKELKVVYSLIKEFFDTEIQMVAKSNGLSKLYDVWLKYWTNNNEWDTNVTKDGIFSQVTYNGIRYNVYNQAFIIKKYLTGFQRKITEIEVKIIKNDKNNPESGSNAVAVKTASDLKKSLYQTFKNVNDKWVIDKKDGDRLRYTWGLEGDVDSNNELKYNDNREFLFDHFFFVDRINRDIGGDLLLDFRVLKDYYEKVNSKNSLYSIIGELAKMNEMIFHPLTSYINFGGLTANSNKNALIDGLFKPINTLDFQSTSPVFIMQYVGKNASYQYENQNHIPDVVKIDFSNERFESPSKSPFNDLTDTNKVNEPVAFFVDMGIKNQNMFRGISLDQAEFRETNESITVWDQLTSQKQNRSVQTIGNNIYPILSRRSYTCKVESLGNMMIQPTMYFYLRYIPLFSGLYLITKVSHSIQPNNVVTNFEGVRMSSLNFPLVSEFISTLTKEILEKGVNNVLAAITPNTEYYKNLSSDVKTNINTIYSKLKLKGITNNNMIAAILAVVSKESAFRPVRENTYTKNVEQIKTIFNGNTTFTTEILPAGDDTIKFMAQNPQRYYNKVYYGRKTKNGTYNGNKPEVKKPITYNNIIFDDSSDSDGYKYRGGGFNQITGREVYKKYGLEDNPNGINNVETAAEVLAEFYIDNITLLNEKSRYGISGNNGVVALNSFNDLTQAYNAAFNVTAGIGFTLERARVKYGDSYKKGFVNLQSIYDAIIAGEIK
jgi:predicted chitinase